MELLLKDEVYAIIGAAMEVHRELGKGFLESVYHEALIIELLHRSIAFESQRRLAIRYKQEILKQEFIADLICFGTLLVELKSSTHLSSIDEAQLLNYLRATGLHTGLLINFGKSSLEWKRMVL